MENKKNVVVALLLSLFLDAIIILITIAMCLTGPMTDAIQDQLVALRNGDINKAYSYLATNTASTITLDDFKDYIKRFPILMNNVSASFSEKQFEDDKGYAKGTLKSADGKKATIEYLLAKENRQWKIVGIHVYE